MENLSNEELNTILQSILTEEIVKHLPLEKIAQQVYQLIEPKLVKLIQDEVDKIQEAELVKNYNHNPYRIRYHAQPVEITTEKVDGSEVIKKLNGNRRHDYWIITSKHPNYAWLVPKIGLNINQFNYISLQKRFACEGYNHNTNSRFQLIKPARVELLWNSQDWKLIETGKIVFLETAKYPTEHNQIIILDLFGNKKSYLKLPENAKTKLISFSSDWNKLAAVLESGEVKIWELPNKYYIKNKSIDLSSENYLTDTFTRKDSTINIIDFSSDGNKLIMADNNGRVEVYEIKTLSERISDGCNWLAEYRDIHSDSKLDKACNHKT